MDYTSRLTEIERGASAEAALALFDALPPAPVELLTGRWRGSTVPTGHPFDGLLEALGWHGKRFDNTEVAHPLVFATPGGARFSLNPAWIPLSLVSRYAARLRHPALLRLARALAPALATGAPKARLRMMQFRGVTSATMIYDDLPIHDAFRMVNRDTFLGVMDMRGAHAPFVFVLKREAG